MRGFSPRLHSYLRNLWVARVRLTETRSRNVPEEASFPRAFTAPGCIPGLATKYDLVVLDRRGPRLYHPLQEMAEYASATFWPRGAIQAAAAGTGGGVLAVVAWRVGIPIVSGVLIVIGLFLAVMAVWTFVHQARRALR